MVLMLTILNLGFSVIIENSIMCFVALFFWWIWLATNIKRCHDLGWSGYTYFWFFLPIANFILLFMLIFRKGTEGPNEYGEPPK
jgi:uncharacterized membrane protein YhaH (DUF805 family)